MKTAKTILSLMVFGALILPLGTHGSLLETDLPDTALSLFPNDQDPVRSSPDVQSELVLGSLTPNFMRLLTGQDKKDPQGQDDDDDEGEIMSIEVKVGQRPTGGSAGPMNIKFALKEPLTLKGVTTEAGTLREILVKGIEYILQQQSKDGAWSFNSKTQVRKKDSSGADIKPNGFLQTAGDSMVQNMKDGRSVVLTALCSMALRRHYDLDPGRIGPAVEKGLRYVIDNAPKYTKEKYGPWTWGFSIMFMCEEFKLTKDSTLQAQIKESIKGVMALLKQYQHKTPEKPFKVADNLKPTAEELAYITEKAKKGNGKEEEERPKRPSNGGYFGIIPSEHDEIGKKGVLIKNVTAKNPAANAGLKDGDRIVAIDGHEVEDLDDLLSLIDSLKPGAVVKVKIQRGGAKKKGTMIEDEGTFFQQGRRQQQRPSGAKSVPSDGGWAYYRTGSVSFTTSTCILALMQAKEIGVEVPDEMLSSAIAFVEAMQMRRKNTDEIAFRYHTGVPASTGRGADVRASVGRLGVAGLTLLKAGKYTVEDLGKALETFVKHRDELDKVKGYMGNHVMKSWLNASYYFLYGHFYAAYARHSLPSADQRKKIGAFIQEALLKSRNPEGTWTDHEMWGQLYGTAMAMMAFGELKDLAPSLYKSAPPVVNTGDPKK